MLSLKESYHCGELWCTFPADLGTGKGHMLAKNQSEAIEIELACQDLANQKTLPWNGPSANLRRRLHPATFELHDW